MPVATPIFITKSPDDNIYRARALAQLRILKQQMQLTPTLNMGSRAVDFGDGVTCFCEIQFNYEYAYVVRTAFTGTVSGFITTNHTETSPLYNTANNYLFKNGGFVGPSSIPHGDRHFYDSATQKLYSWKWHSSQYKIPDLYAIDGSVGVYCDGAAVIPGNAAAFIVCYGRHHNDPNDVRYEPDRELIVSASFAVNSSDEYRYIPPTQDDNKGFAFEITLKTKSVYGDIVTHTVVSTGVQSFQSMFVNDACDTIFLADGGKLTLTDDGSSLTSVFTEAPPKTGEYDATYLSLDGANSSSVSGNFSTTITEDFSYTELYSGRSTLPVTVNTSAVSTNVGDSTYNNVVHNRTNSYIAELNGVNINLHRSTRAFTRAAYNYHIAVDERYEVTDSYIHTLDLDLGVALLREDTHTYTFAGNSDRVLCYVTTFGAWGTENVVLNPRAAVQVSPSHTVKRRLVLIHGRGKRTVLAAKTDTIESPNYIVGWPAYWTDGVLTDEWLNDTEDPYYERIQTAWNNCSFRSIIKTDWDWTAVRPNYYFNASPVSTPGDKESEDGSMNFNGDFFWPAWLKNVGRQSFWARDASRRSSMDWLDRTQPEPTDAERSYENQPESMGTNWMSNDGSYAQVVLDPKTREVMYSCYDTAFGRIFNGFATRSGDVVTLDHSQSLLPISHISNAATTR